MDLNDLAKLLESKKREINHYVQRKLPIKAGAKAKSIVQENFRLGGFQDGGLTLWAATRRQSTGYGADAKRGPLLSSRKVLYNGTGYTPGPGYVTIYNDVLYAWIHNEGGTTHPRVTKKMRKFAWENLPDRFAYTTHNEQLNKYGLKKSCGKNRILT